LLTTSRWDRERPVETNALGNGVIHEVLEGVEPEESEHLPDLTGPRTDVLIDERL